MDLLKRSHAPILDAAWELVDAEAKRVLELTLAGRKVVDFRGPHGWKYAAVNTGRLKILSGAQEEVSLGVRLVQPLIETRVPIKLAIMELDTVARGADDLDLSPVVDAAKRIALVEDGAIFNGLATAAIEGILPSTPHNVPLPADILQLPRVVVDAKEILRKSGIGGPYVLVLGTAHYELVYAATEDGRSLSKRLEQLVPEGHIVQSDAIQGGALVSARGGDYELTVGQDLSIGYAYHTKHEVELYLTESFTFRVLEPAAAVRIGSPAPLKA
ncbi:MAG: Bacteriocin [Myxococcaceae bacterium]|jgi:uncharacterized linocin/CFP29 family protein|nr:Bacteriocin [Myxococcaceae bacterium]MEA2748020.1 hypothetical protein [Myxococcales bacterium]